MTLVAIVGELKARPVKRGSEGPVDGDGDALVKRVKGVTLGKGRRDEAM